MLFNCLPPTGRAAALPRRAAAAALLMGAIAAGPAQAQTLYRCGSTYQDRPCAASDGRVVGRSAPAVAPASATDADCAQRGEAAQRLTWLRQAGATQEQQLHELQQRRAGAATDAQLIAEVYRLRGTAPEVRAAIEAQCMADKERTARDPALAAAVAARAAATTQAEAAAADPRSVPAETRGAVNSLQAPAAAPPPMRRTQCEDVERRLAQISASAREGGSAAHMEWLNRQRRALQQQREDAGC